MAIAGGMTVTSLPAQSQDQSQRQAGQTAQGQPAQGQPARNWKDRAEYDLYNASVKEQDPNKRLALLNSWKEKYTKSDYAPERLWTSGPRIFIQTRVLIIIGMNAKHSMMLPSAYGFHRDLPLLSDL